MFPNLFEATTEYWRQLDEIESRYQQGELSIEEVDREVEILMKLKVNQARPREENHRGRRNGFN